MRIRVLVVLSIFVLVSCAKDEVEQLVITTKYVALVTSSSAQAGGNVVSGIVNERGVCWSEQSTPTIADNKSSDGSGSGEFTSTMTGLNPGTLYYFRAYAKNEDVISYGQIMTFQTKGESPTVDEVLYVVSKNETRVIWGGAVCSNDLSTEVFFEFGLDTNYGFSIPPGQNPINGSGCYEVSVPLIYEPSTVYHYRIKASNALGTTYSKDHIFNSPSPQGTKGFVADVDGNKYQTISILGYEWMAENLNVAHFNDGTPIPLVSNNDLWTNLQTPGRSYFFNDSIKYSKDFGALYNWFTVNNSKLCPANWHMPTREDWESLIGLEAIHLKEAGTLYWDSPNNGDNSSGFSARAGGLRVGNGGIWTGISETAAWWSAPAPNQGQVYVYISRLDDKKINFDGHYKTTGLSIRCVKD